MIASLQRRITSSDCDERVRRGAGLAAYVNRGEIHTLLARELLLVVVLVVAVTVVCAPLSIRLIGTSLERYSRTFLLLLLLLVAPARSASGLLHARRAGAARLYLHTPMASSYTRRV